MDQIANPVFDIIIACIGFNIGITFLLTVISISSITVYKDTHLKGHSVYYKIYWIFVNIAIIFTCTLTLYNMIPYFLNFLFCIK